ncbi:exosome complex exonuclease DIS3/RRP44 [Nematocida sp. AWRm80]|nr:exosome complex exonuclease DIS3/RRP44 [Nematocida sp. AWRm80]
METSVLYTERIAGTNIKLVNKNFVCTPVVYEVYNNRIDLPIGVYYIPTIDTLIKYISLLEIEILSDIIVLRSSLNYIRAINNSVYNRILRVIDINAIRIYEDAGSLQIESTGENQIEEIVNTQPEIHTYNIIKQSILQQNSHLAEENIVIVCTTCECTQEIKEHVRVLEIQQYIKNKREKENINTALYINSTKTAPITVDTRTYAMYNNIEVGNISIRDIRENGRVHCGIEGGQLEIEIENKDLNRAINGDKVAIQIVEDHITHMKGKVIEVLQRSNNIILCTPETILDQNTALVKPVNKNVPMFQVDVSEDGGKSISPSDILLGCIEDWSPNSTYAQGYILKNLGPSGGVEEETAALLYTNSIINRPFREDSLKELPSENWIPTETDLAEREDLRMYPISSIDPEGCIDIDDALHARILPDGTVEVGVHIADVTHFVQENSAQDREGRLRGCTVYLPNKRIDMLPSLLGTNLCSLHKNIDRLAFSVIWHLSLTPNHPATQPITYSNLESLNLNDPGVEDLFSITVLSKRFTKSIINSKESFTYDQAADILKQNAYKEKSTFDSLKLLKIISSILRKDRLKEGAFLIESNECRVSSLGQATLTEMQHNREAHFIRENEQEEWYNTHSLVEEFMLYANQTVAKHISSVFPNESLIRIHPPPTKESFAELQNALQIELDSLDSLDTQTYQVLIQKLSENKSQGTLIQNNETNRRNTHKYILQLDPSNPTELSNTLKALSLRPQVRKCIGAWASKCMTQAIYVPSGLGLNYHYGLAMSNYTHFTSPIRRYADVVVHRILTHCITSQKYPPITEQELGQVCNSINRSYRNAKYVSRAAHTLYIRYLLPHTPITAVLTYITPESIEVYLPEYGVDAELHLPEEEYSIEENTIVSKTERYHLLSQIQVILLTEYPREIRVQLVSR